jgi:hypothetical protein
VTREKRGPVEIWLICAVYDSVGFDQPQGRGLVRGAFSLFFMPLFLMNEDSRAKHYEPAAVISYSFSKK